MYNKINKIGYIISDWLLGIKYKFFNLITKRTKYNIIKTDLSPDEYYDADTRLLHANFTLLKDFVEVECAWLEAYCSDERERKQGVTLLHHLRYKEFRNPELGLKYLQREENYLPNSKESKIIIELYEWWVNERPNRFDVDDVLQDIPSDMTEKQKNKIYDAMNKQFDSYIKEDTKKLIQLIKIRNCLWT
mgnify:FL=1